eukprot:GHVL01002562.1.p1 GENE.GHVL01002562.1~~GHVL01002562.1.p1  ORF type:complete len:472 (+),score=59.36 GHVL01002562.1:36-1451(+)
MLLPSEERSEDNCIYKNISICVPSHIGKYICTYKHINRKKNIIKDENNIYLYVEQIFDEGGGTEETGFKMYRCLTHGSIPMTLVQKCPYLSETLRASSSPDKTSIHITIIGRSLITTEAIWRCFDASFAEWSVFKVFSIMCAAQLLKMYDVYKACSSYICEVLSNSSVALACWIANQYDDAVLLRHCYWFLKRLICSRKLPTAWTILAEPDCFGTCPTTLQNGHISFKDYSTPLSVFNTVLIEDSSLKSRILKAQPCYTICEVIRTRTDSLIHNAGYPHEYTLQMDHSKEEFLWGSKEEEQSSTLFYSSKQKCDLYDTDFMGQLNQNFWGNKFTLMDWGVPKYMTNDVVFADFPMDPRKSLLEVIYETNLIGDCPRKIRVVTKTEKEICLENIKPKWDNKLHSYALPFFGRVKMASAKNFQLMMNGDENNIILMFGKIKKDLFCLDFRHPLSALDAFAIASAALAKKRVVS